ncbi:MAG: hypothetical protein ABSB22_12750 [Thermodesulfobacteriota bacterium]|jgi:hypothetical protein
MQPNDDFLMGELERQMEHPFDFLNEYDREMEMIMNPWEAENPVSKQLSMLEAQIENSIVRPSAIQQEDPAPLPLSGPIRGLRSPDPPILDESTWRGIKEPQPSIFGRIRSSKSGARGSSNREDDERYCWRDHHFVKKEACAECTYWNGDIDVCEYEAEDSEED